MNIDEIVRRALQSDEAQLRKFLDCLDTIYYTYPDADQALPDTAYDLVRSIYENRFGTYLTNKISHDLPYWLGSQDKFKLGQQTQVDQWMNDFRPPYLVSGKLDGISALLRYDGTRTVMFTREGGDITPLAAAMIRYGKIPSLNIRYFDVRGELIMNQEVFRRKYSQIFKNARNMVSGLANSKTHDRAWKERVADLDFVVYEIIQPSMKPSEQLQRLEKYGFPVPLHTMQNSIELEKLVPLLERYRESSPYELDGLVVISDHIHSRVTVGNPPYSFAFKISGKAAITEVIAVKWKISKYGVMKPVVLLRPVELSGVTIQRATAFNARYIWEFSVGPGTKVEITRSGETIPYILDVLEGTTASFPPPETYHWNKNRVEIIAEETAAVSQEKTIRGAVSFFSIIGAKFLGESTISKIVTAGYNTIPKIVHMTKTQLSAVPGIQEKGAVRIRQEIKQAINKASLARIMGASSIFPNLGEKRTTVILNNNPDMVEQWATQPPGAWRYLLLKIPGMGALLADVVVDHMEEFIVFLHKMAPYTFAVTQKKKKRWNVVVVMSGFRSRALQDEIEARGGQVTTSVSGNTTHILVKDKRSTTGKVAKARQLGVSIMTVPEFCQEYHI